MEKEEYQPIVEKTEQPEPDFVPYCGSNETKSGKRSLYSRILMILAVISVLGFVFLLIGRHINFYHSTVNSLHFDYRSGEEVFEDPTLLKGSYAQSLSQTIGRQQVTTDAVMYLFREEEPTFDAISEYHNVHNVNEDVLNTRSGSKNWPFTKRMSLQVQLQNGKPPVTDSYRKPLLAELFYGTESSDRYSFECYDSYDSLIGKQTYVCEIWLLADCSLPQTVYYTLYRYYIGTQLKAVRVLSNTDDITEVYEIKSMVIG